MTQRLEKLPSVDHVVSLPALVPEQQAAIFSLTHFEQLDRNEVAAVLNISPESVSTSLYKARHRLREQLNIIQGAQNQ